MMRLLFLRFHVFDSAIFNYKLNCIFFKEGMLEYSKLITILLIIATDLFGRLINIGGYLLKTFFQFFIRKGQLFLVDDLAQDQVASHLLFSGASILFGKLFLGKSRLFHGLIIIGKRPLGLFNDSFQFIFDH